MWAAATVLLVSIAALAVGWKRPLLQEDRWHAAPGWISRLLVNELTRSLGALLGMGLLVVVIWSGLAGTQVSPENFAPIFVFVTFWLGLVPLSLLFGDSFKVINPWRTLGRLFEAGFRLLIGRERPPLAQYPDWLGRWPAALGLLGFLWFELVFGFAREGITPRDVAIATFGYTALTFSGILVFGARNWIERGEGFSVFYGMVATLSPRRSGMGASAYADRSSALAHGLEGRARLRSSASPSAGPSTTGSWRASSRPRCEDSPMRCSRLGFR